MCLYCGSAIGKQHLTVDKMFFREGIGNFKPMLNNCVQFSAASEFLTSILCAAPTDAKRSDPLPATPNPASVVK
jgi:hypothetical protein